MVDVHFPRGRTLMRFVREHMYNKIDLSESSWSILKPVRASSTTPGKEEVQRRRKRQLFCCLPPSQLHTMLQLPNAAIKAIFFWIFKWIYSKILGAMCDGTPRMIPTIKNSILMESASSLASRIRSQKVTSFEVVMSHINRIKEINTVLNCVVDERFEEALEEAKKADEFIRSGAKTSEQLESETPFLGVPFTTPESVGVRGLSNTSGIWSRRKAKAGADAGVVSLMREGGAIPLACTNVSEGCFPRETHNPVFGRTHNPYDANRSAGGPFGGEGSVVASSGSPLAVLPSAALPSAFNGVFGHKPSATLRSDASGPMSRCSVDLLPALKILARHSKIQLSLDEPVDVKKLKYYFTDGNDGSAFTSSVSGEIKEAMKKAVNHLRNFHHASVERIHPKGLPNGFPVYNSKTNVDGALGKDDNKVNLRKEIVKAVFGKSPHTFIFLLSSLVAGKSPSQTSANTKEHRDQLFAELQALLGSDGVLLCPAHPTPAFRHNESLARIFDFGCADTFEVLGLPVTYCPAGLNSEGLPIGFQVVAAMNQDRLTLAVAREIERVLGGWKPPPTHGNFTLKNTIFHNSCNEKVKTL